MRRVTGTALLATVAVDGIHRASGMTEPAKERARPRLVAADGGLAPNHPPPHAVGKPHDASGARRDRNRPNRHTGESQPAAAVTNEQSTGVPLSLPQDPGTELSIARQHAPARRAEPCTVSRVRDSRRRQPTCTRLSNGWVAESRAQCSGWKGVSEIGERSGRLPLHCVRPLEEQLHDWTSFPRGDHDPTMSGPSTSRFALQNGEPAQPVQEAGEPAARQAGGLISKGVLRSSAQQAAVGDGRRSVQGRVSERRIRSDGALTAALARGIANSGQTDRSGPPALPAKSLGGPHHGGLQLVRPGWAPGEECGVFLP